MWATRDVGHLPFIGLEMRLKERGTQVDVITSYHGRPLRTLTAAQ